MCTIVALTVCMFQRSVFFNITEELQGLCGYIFYIATELAATDRWLKLGDCESHGIDVSTSLSTGPCPGHGQYIIRSLLLHVLLCI